MVPDLLIEVAMNRLLSTWLVHLLANDLISAAHWCSHVRVMLNSAPDINLSAQLGSELTTLQAFWRTLFVNRATKWIARNSFIRQFFFRCVNTNQTDLQVLPLNSMQTSPTGSNCNAINHNECKYALSPLPLLPTRLDCSSLGAQVHWHCPF